MCVVGAIAGASVVGGLFSSDASKSAASAQANSAAAANAEQGRQFDLSRQDLAPYRSVGGNALNMLASLYGVPQYQAPQPQQGYGGYAGGNISLPTGGSFQLPRGLGNFTNFQGSTQAPCGTQGGAPATRDLSAFFASPNYNFVRSEGQRGIEQSAAARGGAFSGNALRALSDYNSNLASGEFNNYANRLSDLAGIGHSATNTSAQLGANYANQFGNNMMAAGDARASGIIGGANSITGGINSGLQNYLAYRGGMFGSPAATPYTGSYVGWLPQGPG